MARLTLQIPNAKMTKLVTAYGTEQALKDEVLSVLVARLREHNREEARKAVVMPPDPDLSDVTVEFS